MIWIFWLFFIIEEVVRNYYMIKKKLTINHGAEAVIRLCFSIALVIVMDPALWIQVVMFFLGAFFSFWLLFNIGLNALRGKPFGYVGKTAWLDKIEAFSPSIIGNVFFKAVLATGFIYAYFYPELLSSNYWG